MIHVGVDAWNIPGDRRGIGRYVRAILRSWSAELSTRVRVSLIVPEWATWIVAPRYRRELDGRHYAIRSRRRHTRFAPDVLWFPFNGPSWEEFSTPAVATLHDASTFDLSGFGEETRHTFRRAAARCTRIVTDSEFSKSALARALNIGPDRIVAIPLGVELPRAGEGTDGSEEFGRFALFVGEAEERKGLPELLAVMQTVHERVPEAQLVVAGALTGALAQQAPWLHVLGHVDDRMLARLYRGCTVFVYPSRYEGFGLPVLEAMSRGAPVIASFATAIPEAGGEAALYVPPGDSRALAAAVERVFLDAMLRTQLREAGLLRARSMPWSRTAARTLEVLEAVANGQPR